RVETSRASQILVLLCARRVRVITCAVLMIMTTLTWTRMYSQWSLHVIRLDHILVNLLANALDAMSGQSDRQLWLEGRREEERYVLRVRDNGTGIPPAARVELFALLHNTTHGEHALRLGLHLSASLTAAADSSLSV
ncbi:hypothetical protein GOY11_33925, partial [Pseudomonas aeruginosa]|nr:hypothetical protein [Pseudomonas aeruginosa]